MISGFARLHLYALAVTIFAISLPVFAGPPCVFNLDSGEPLIEVPAAISAHVPPGARVSFFKDSNYGANYLVTESSGKSYVLKRYKESSELEKDLVRMEALTEVLRNSSMGLKATEYTRVTDDIVRHDFIKGKSLHKILEENEDPEGKLQTRYAQMLENLTAHLRLKGVLKTATSAYFVITFRGQEIVLFIHPKNVVIKAGTDEIFVIDPF